MLASCLLLLLRPPTALYKGFVNKKISDTINGVNAAGTAAQGLITNKGSLLGDRSKTLMGFITNLKQYVAAEAKDTVSDRRPEPFGCWGCRSTTRPKPVSLLQLQLQQAAARDLGCAEPLS